MFLDLRDPRRALVLRLRRGARWDVVAVETDAAERLVDLIRGKVPS
jgi:hypothetical protein